MRRKTTFISFSALADYSLFNKFFCTRWLTILLFNFLSFNLPFSPLWAGSSVTSCPNIMVTYSPAEPVVGVPVTFVICAPNSCSEYGLYPYANTSGYGPLVAGTNMSGRWEVTITFNTEGEYHIGLDQNFLPCNFAQIPVGGGQWTMGPDGGLQVPSGLLNGSPNIFCVPLRINGAPVPGGVEIPTLSDWSILILGLLLAISGVVAFKGYAWLKGIN